MPSRKVAMSELSNRLADESSPYLLQHADNPVHWQPWDDRALASARELGRPILLSVGYSACHWCHVMAHESFEDPEVAAVMNQHFVNVKVDREERPDLDKVYQLAQQLLTRQPGGWPLTLFLDPGTLVPFFGGTYFPKTARYQLPGFVDLLHRIAEVFHGRRDELASQGEQIVEVLAGLNPAAPAQPGQDEHALLAAARTALAAQYDQSDGGFGSAPKFPMPGTLERLLRGWAAGRQASDNDRTALDMVMHTLTHMARGGIHDHLGGGFCRYATDRQWMIPHFEKMLYDNGQLLALYADALGVGPDALFEHAATGIADWLIGDMRHPDGPFYAALDADSEGEEGRYYLWRRDEIRQLLTEDEYLVVETLYGLDKPANFEGKWNLHRYDAWPSVVSRLSLDRERADALLASARAKLLSQRRTRVPPGLDDKILTGWNGLAIRGLAVAGIRLGRRDWITAAQAAADFLREHAFVDGVLFATWKNGRARHPAYLDDYAGLLHGLLALLAAEWRDADLRFAVTLADSLLTRFEDPEAGGFFFTAHDHERLLFRPKPTQDEATPPGNAVAARALLELGHLMAAQRYLEAANRTIDWSRSLIEQHPASHCGLLTALESSMRAPELIILRGPTDQLDPWLAAAHAGYHPWRSVYGIPDGATELPPYLPRLVSADLAGQPVAYRCEGFRCSLPETSLEAFRASL